MTPHRMNPPTSFMIRPAISWSVRGETPQILGNVAYTGYRGLLPNVRNDAGIVGASDWKNRYSIWPGSDSGGSSGSGEATGHHIASADETASACRPKCASSERTERSTISGQCVNSSTPLKNAIATTGRTATRAARPTTRVRRIARSIQAGAPASSIGAATSVNSMCCTMWALYRYPSARSCTGQSAPAHRTATPARNSRARRRSAGSPVARSRRRTAHT
jgi:hypothetical protein